MRRRSSVVAVRMLALAAACAFATPARAQCPDGSAPPCGVTLASAVRRADPPLDPRAWIVLPFEVPRDDGLDWVRDASANLLYLDLSRWSDLRVVDDERVADLLRETPRQRPLSLSEGQLLAHRAGARNLVMGDVLKAGGRIVVVAKVFDVRDGKRLRSVRQEVNTPDSLFAVFSRLAPAILDLKAPGGSSVGEFGTRRIDAYQEYLAGVKLLNAFDLPNAHRHLSRAIELDSTFALAHYKLALALLWGSGIDPRGRIHAERALQLAGSLPERERTLIKAFVYFPRGDFRAMCETVRPLVRADSSDVDALAAMADCLYHDRVLIPVPGDSTRLQFRGSLNESFRLFGKVLELDPTYHLAYQHLIDSHLDYTRGGVLPGSQPIAGGPQLYLFLRRDGDTLVQTVPARTPTAPLVVQAAYDSAFTDLSRSGSRRRNMQIARSLAEQWLAASPLEPRAHRAAGRVYALMGEVARGREHLRLGAGNLGREDSATFAFENFQANWGVFDFVEAFRWLDSAGAVPPAFAAHVQAARGKMRTVDSILTGGNVNAATVRYRQLMLRAVMGLPAGDSAALLEGRLEGTMPPIGLARRTLMFALRAPRTSWLPIDSLPGDWRLRPAAAMARNDTAALRRAARSLDSASRAARRELGIERGFSVVAVDAYLALKDTARAFSMVRFALDSVVPLMGPLTFAETTIIYAMLTNRLMLIRADLAAATGQRQEAALWYERVLQVWAGADPEFQPTIERVRRALSAVKS